MSHDPADDNFADRLKLERIDRDIFTGWCHAGAPLRAFGGQVAAQALVAAGTTVDQPDRLVHSLHGYFLRPGRTADHIVYLVDRPRDGRSFSTRRVRAVQYGETIFTMAASFAVHDDGPEHQAPAPAAPAPESLPEINLPAGDANSEFSESGYPEHRLLDLRFVGQDQVTEMSAGRSQRMTWVRTRERLADDQLTHVCAMTYFSDLTLVGTALVPHGGRGANPELMLASIDHAMWFHGPFRADDWLLFDQDSPVARGGHGLARGSFYTADGTLVASVVQEVLMRIKTVRPGEA